MRMNAASTNPVRFALRLVPGDGLGAGDGVAASSPAAGDGVSVAVVVGEGLCAGLGVGEATTRGREALARSKVDCVQMTNPIENVSPMTAPI